MKKAIIASLNGVKIQAAERALTRMFADESFTCVGAAVASGVGEQPLSDAETYQGAVNRLAAIRETVPDADLWFAFEGGVEQQDDEYRAFAWALVCDASGRTGKGRSATFFLPPAVAEHIRQGKELGEADDIVFGRVNSKQSNGAVGLLTDDVVTRTSYYADAAVLALIPFKNPHLYT